MLPPGSAAGASHCCTCISGRTRMWLSKAMNWQGRPCRSGKICYTLLWHSLSGAGRLCCVKGTMREQQSSVAPTLRRWLAERTVAERAILARLWALPPELADPPEQLADAILQPDTVQR